MFLRLVPLILAALLLGAHFLRYGHIPLVVVCAASPVLLVIKKRWALQLLQCLMFIGVLVWAHATYVLVQQRIAVGAPWVRMSLILAAVTAFTLVAGFLLRSPSVRKRYP
jgi:hypothetical protein